MIAEEWMRFAHTGSIADYLAYSETKIKNSQPTAGNIQGKGEEGNGADHSAYRNDSGSNAHRGI